jgi:DNA-directed RNA polymerase specialized sigma24 family protein
MLGFHSSETHIERNHWFSNKPVLQDTEAEQRQNLYWAALIITGNHAAAEQSIVDAGALANTNSYAFRDWLVRWGRSATARAAVNTVRAFIHETSVQYADRKCSHRGHAPLLPAAIRSLRELDAQDIIERLDILARATLVLYGCQHASLAECALVLDVPVETVVAAYCRALECYPELEAKSVKAKRSDSLWLHLLRRDSDGVPVWDCQAPSHSTR